MEVPPAQPAPVLPPVQLASLVGRHWPGRHDPHLLLPTCERTRSMDSLAAAQWLTIANLDPCGARRGAKAPLGVTAPRSWPVTAPRSWPDGHVDVARISAGLLDGGRSGTRLVLRHLTLRVAVERVLHIRIALIHELGRVDVANVDALVARIDTAQRHRSDHPADDRADERLAPLVAVLDGRVLQSQETGTDADGGATDAAKHEDGLDEGGLRDRTHARVGEHLEHLAARLDESAAVHGNVAVRPLGQPLDAALEAAQAAEEAAGNHLDEKVLPAERLLHDELDRVVDRLQDRNDQRAERDGAEVVGACTLEASQRDWLAARDAALGRIGVEVPRGDDVARGHVRDVEERLVPPPR
mmetsp:Transcript_27643/g.70421  ORF Transcript_27643/g.70421 Transcript_27643/m.70421 type:complete len:356 (+) Transcript_27643:790-1857(+)